MVKNQKLALSHRLSLADTFQSSKWPGKPKAYVLQIQLEQFSTKGLFQ